MLMLPLRRLRHFRYYDYGCLRCYATVTYAYAYDV